MCGLTKSRSMMSELGARIRSLRVLRAVPEAPDGSGSAPSARGRRIDSLRAKWREETVSIWGDASLFAET